jgi:hypothetical protein
MAGDLTDPLLKFPKSSFRAKRLINIPTGKATISKAQEGWLVETARSIPDSRQFTIYMFGYASKLGFAGQGEQDSDSSNVALSFRRANEATRFMELANPRVTTHVDRFFAEGNHAYSAAGDDDSGMWRAVEVHVFLDDPPPPPPEPVPDPPCGGAQRYRKWSVATPGGFTFSPLPGATAGVNIVAFRRETDGKVRFYVQIGMGLGFSWSGPGSEGWKKVWDAIKGGLSISGMSWPPFAADTPFTFSDLNGATCEIASAGGGVVAGYQGAVISVRGQVWYRRSDGCMFGMKDFFEHVDVSGPDLQFGVGGSGLGGPLIEVN